jgi:hypothetical protein
MIQNRTDQFFLFDLFSPFDLLLDRDQFGRGGTLEEASQLVEALQCEIRERVVLGVNFVPGEDLGLSLRVDDPARRKPSDLPMRIAKIM